MLWLLSGPLGFTCWFSFSTSIQFYLLLISNVRFISFLYLNLYALGDGVRGLSCKKTSMCLDLHLN